MKSYATFFIIAVMILSLVFLLVTRERGAHDAPAEVVVVEDAGLDAGVEGGPPILAAVDAAPDAPADKPLRVATLGWELSAGGAAFTSASPRIELAPETTLDAIEQRLARGGADPQGADVAVLPLPSFIASFDRLRALEPRVFLVVGYSHGREEVHAAPGALAKAPPGGDEVKLAAFAPGSDASVRALSSESATVLGLFALDLLGVAPSRIKIVAPGTPEAKTALVSAVNKGAPDERKVAFSTSDAARLIPIVAVAPKGVIDSREPALREWSKGWLDGQTKGKSDVPNLARRLAAKEGLPFANGVGGAPEALVLVERLGQVENVTLDEESSIMGPLAVRFPASLETVAARTWTLARGSGLTAAAAPDPLPIDARVISTIAPPPKAEPLKDSEADGGSTTTFGPLPSGATMLAQLRAVDGEGDKVAGQVWFLSGVFPRAVFKVAAKGGAKAAQQVAASARDKGVAAGRLGTSANEPAGVFATADILAPP